MSLRPILSALLKNPLGPALVAMQIALTLAVLANAMCIVSQRLELISRPTGIDVENIFVINSVGIDERFVPVASIRSDLAFLRGLDGVVAATPINATPLSDQGGRIGVMLKPDDQAHGVRTNYYEVDDQAIVALGLRLIAGRTFHPDEILLPREAGSSVNPVHEVIVSRALADQLYPRQEALGKIIYDVFGYLSSPAVIVGIVERMQGSRLTSDSAERVVLAPRFPYPDGLGALYLVRTEPGKRNSVMRIADAYLQDSDPHRIIEWSRPLGFFKDLSYRADYNMTLFLIGVMTALLIVTCVGTYGLAMFSVRTRSRQIGIRRALGARRVDILVHFLCESALITTVGIAIGCLLALVASAWLSQHYGLPRLDLRFVACGMPILWMAGLLGAWYPARRASSVSPAMATRTT